MRTTADLQTLLRWHARKHFIHFLGRHFTIPKLAHRFHDTAFVGLITVQYFKDPVDPQWADAPDVKAYKEFFEKYYPEGNINDGFNISGFSIAWGLVQVLERCGDELTRENVMKQVTSFQNVEAPMMLPGVKWNTGPDDFSLIEYGQLSRFDGEKWVLFGQVMGN